jgi:hypothetical protein
MSKYYRSTLGFTNATDTKDFLTGKDIVSINFELIESYNERLIDIFSRIQTTLPYPAQNFEQVVLSAYHTILTHDILYSLSNHGRAPEFVYYVWMQGYLSATLFKPLLEQELNCVLSQNGADDLSNPDTFSRKSDPDLVDHKKKIYVEVQSGFKGGKIDIKKSKVKTDAEYTYYIACFDCFNGQFVLLNTEELLTLPADAWYNNPQWEGALCHTVPNERLKEWNKPNLFTNIATTY